MDTKSSTVLVKVIVASQRSIIGPLAVEQANQVENLEVSSDLLNVKIKGDSKLVLTNLVKQYEQVFGQASVEVCKDAVKEVITQLSERDLPDILK